MGGDEELFVAGGLAGLIVCKLPELPRLARKILPQLLPPYNMFELALSSETIFYASSSAVLEAYEALCFPRFKVSAGTPYAFFSAEIKPPFPVKLMLLSPFEFEKLRGGEDVSPGLTWLARGFERCAPIERGFVSAILSLRGDNGEVRAPRFRAVRPGIRAGGSLRASGHS